MDESKEGLLSAAEDMIQAFHANDAEGLMHALSSFFQMCDQDEPQEEEKLAYGGDVGNSDDLGDEWETETDQRKMAKYFGER